MAIVFLDIYAATDPNGSVLVTLDDSDIAAFEMRQGENELGAGQFTIRRDHADATEANLAAGNYVKVRIPLIDADPVFGFWIDEHDDKILATDEEGGEVLTRGGPGSLFILSHAALLDDFHVLTQHSRGSYNVPGYWTWRNEPYGAILQRLLEEGRAEPGTPLVDVTDDFTRQDDSDSNAWPTVTEIISVPIGTDGLSVYRTLVESGELFVRIDPDLFLHAYQTRGDDLTGGSYGAGVVRFVKGENILTGLDREGRGTRAATHAIVEGADKVYRQVVSPDYVPGTTGKWESVSYDASDDTALLDKVGAEELRKRAADQQAIELEFRAGDDEANGRYLPFKHFQTGDTVTLDTGTGEYDFDDVDFPVTGFRIVLGEASRDADDEESARSFRWVVELGGGSMGLGGGSGGDCKCGPGLRLCHDETITGATVLLDNFNRVEASGWGTSSYGPAWVEAPFPNNATSDVDGTQGRFVVGAGGGDDYMDAAAILPAADGFELLMEFRTGTVPGAGDYAQAWLSWIDAALDDGLFYYLGVSSDALFGEIRIQNAMGGGGGTALVVKTDWVSNTLYKVRVSQNPASNVCKMRVWPSASSEPTTWDITTTLTGIDLADASPFIEAGIDTDVAYVHAINNIEITPLTTTSCIFGGPSATSGDPEEGCNNRAAPCNHDHAYTSAQVFHEGGTVADALDAIPASVTDATYLVGSAHAGLSAEIVVGATPGGELGGTWGSPTVDATHSGSTHASRAPATSNYLVGTADAGLSAEIVVGTTPGGELGGTWASPTVDATHSGSSHAGVVTTHEAASDPHTGYRLESADHSHATTGLQGGTVAHSALTGLTVGDPHTQYVQEADANWVDLTDGGATTLHSHAGGGSPAADPGDIADPTLATAQEVAEKLNDLMAAMRTAGQLV